MDTILKLFEFILHFDVYLTDIIARYGTWTLAFLFGIIFMETGFVVTPFLPGDSLIFAAATFAARGSLNIWSIFLLLSVAAVAGDTANYWIGHRVGAKAYSGEIRWVKKEYMQRAHRFFEKYGGRAIFLARFVPIVRTFVPFIAGISRMPYGYFIRWNIIGGVVWVGIFSLLGYFFGNIPFVQDNFELVILAIIVISVIPALVEVWNVRKESRKAEAETLEAE